MQDTAVTTRRDGFEHRRMKGVEVSLVPVGLIRIKLGIEVVEGAGFKERQPLYITHTETPNIFQMKGDPKLGHSPKLLQRIASVRGCYTVSMSTGLIDMHGQKFKRAYSQTATVRLGTMPYEFGPGYILVDLRSLYTMFK